MRAIFWLWLILFLDSAFAGNDFKSGYFETMGYPIVIHSVGDKKDSGFLVEFTDEIAKYLKAKSVNVPLPRKRIENALKSGEVHVICYWSPLWAERSLDFEWSKKGLRQYEYLVGKSANGAPPDEVAKLKGKRIAMLLGFRYPRITDMVDSGEIIRIDRNSTEGLFDAVNDGVDYLMLTRPEILGYFEKFPEKKAAYVLGKKPFAVTATQCAISPKSPWSKMQIDEAIGQMEKSGKINQLILKYHLQ